MSKLPPVGAELISVMIGGEQYAIDIMAVREIRGWTRSTPVPHAPEHVLGMINLRGAVLPVIDLGARLGLGKIDPDKSSVVVVAQIGGRQVGLLVDAVCDIVMVTENMLQETPDVGHGEIRNFVDGIMTIDEAIVGLLSLENLLPSDGRAAA